MGAAISAVGCVKTADGNQARRLVPAGEIRPSENVTRQAAVEAADKGFIYVFTRPDDTIKLGMTSREEATDRLKEHLRNDMIKENAIITVYVCPHQVRKVETTILQEPRINNARIRRERKTEILDNKLVTLQYVKNVIRKVIAEVNNMPESAVEIELYQVEECCALM